jgi:hypothetical protein
LRHAQQLKVCPLIVPALVHVSLVSASNSHQRLCFKYFIKQASTSLG